MMDFKKFPKIKRWSREVVVTEKIDGTNGLVCIDSDGKMLVGSRNRWIHPELDNHGFAAWCQANEDELLRLGPGYHYGEWYGCKIQRGYCMDSRRWSLFDVDRYADADLPECVSLVPEIWRGNMDDLDVGAIMSGLYRGGSLASPGFTDPEGIIIKHVESGALFKKTFCGDRKNV